MFIQTIEGQFINLSLVQSIRRQVSPMTREGASCFRFEFGPDDGDYAVGHVTDDEWMRTIGEAGGCEGGVDTEADEADLE